MNKIRVIDLLNKIAKGETLPEKIKYDNKIFEKTVKDYHVYAGEWLFKDYCVETILNHEIEIIEEEKEIEELSPYIKVNDLEYEVAMNRKIINELVREVNKIKNKK